MSDEGRVSALELEQKNQAYKIMGIERQLEENSKSIVDFRDSTVEKLARIQLDIESEKAYEAVNTKQIAELRRLLEKIDANQEVFMMEKKQAQEFWREMKAKLLTAGILSTAGILGAALIFASKEYIKSLTGG